MARWHRAARLLKLPRGSRVLDLGCAFGYGTRLLASRFETHGQDLDAAYIARARASLPNVKFTTGRADSIPYPSLHFDAVICLDVLEHVPDDRAVTEEIARVLRPGGTLILSVPNRGALAALDSLNVYGRIAPPTWPPPTDDPSWGSHPHHRHYSPAELAALLGPHFSVRATAISGLGVAELINLVLLVTLRGVLKAPRLYHIAQYLYFLVYLLEDLLPTGRWGYHLMVVARRE